MQELKNQMEDIKNAHILELVKLRDEMQTQKQKHILDLEKV